METLPGDEPLKLLLCFVCISFWWLIFEALVTSILALSDIWQHWNMITNKLMKVDRWQVCLKEGPNSWEVCIKTYVTQSSTQKIPINKRLPREIWIREYKHRKQTRPSPSLCLLVSTLLIASAANTEKVTFLQRKKPLRGR